MNLKSTEEAMLWGALMYPDKSIRQLYLYHVTVGYTSAYLSVQSLEKRGLIRVDRSGGRVTGYRLKLTQKGQEIICPQNKPD